MLEIHHSHKLLMHMIIIKVRAWGRKFTAAPKPPVALAGVCSRKRVGVRWFNIWPKTARHDMNYITALKFQDTISVFPSLPPLALTPPPIGILLNISQYFAFILLVADILFISSGVSLPLWGPTVFYSVLWRIARKFFHFCLLLFHFRPVTD